MNDRELEQKLKQALEHAAPNDVDALLSRCGAQNHKIVPISPAKKQRRIAPWLAAACLVLAIGTGAFGVGYQQANAVASVVSLDVNPCVRLEVNRSEKVLSATPVNADADQILDGMDLTGTDLQVAVNAIIGSLLKHGYVDELANSVLVSVEDDDRTRGTTLEEKLTLEISQVLKSASINGAILSQTFPGDAALQQKAEEYGISQGKAALIQTLVENSTHLTFESLAGLSINELNLLANSKAVADQSGQNTESDSIRSTGTASQDGYIGVEAAKQAALTHAGVTESQISHLEADYDYEDDRMVYAVEFEVNGLEYEYDIDVFTGAVIKYEQDGREEQPAGGGQTTAQGSGSGQTHQGAIDGQTARDIALAHAGVQSSDVRELEVELDDGCYQVEFKAGRYEYDYEIRASDGSIIRAERDE